MSGKGIVALILCHPLADVNKELLVCLSASVEVGKCVKCLWNCLTCCGSHAVLNGLGTLAQVADNIFNTLDIGDCSTLTVIEYVAKSCQCLVIDIILALIVILWSGLWLLLYLDGFINGFHICLVGDCCHVFYRQRLCILHGFLIAQSLCKCFRAVLVTHHETAFLSIPPTTAFLCEFLAGTNFIFRQLSAESNKVHRCGLTFLVGVGGRLDGVTCGRLLAKLGVAKRLHAAVLRKRLRLAVAAVNPLLELLFADRSNGTKSLPTVFIVGEVCLSCALDVGETIHHLVLVKAAVLVHLVNDKHITLRGVFGEEHVDVVAVNALCAANVAVGVLHFLLPLLAAGISTTTYRAFRVLDGNVVAINLDVSFLVVTCLFLCFGRLGIGFLLGCCQCCLHGIRLCFYWFGSLNRFCLYWCKFGTGFCCCFAICADCWRSAILLNALCFSALHGFCPGCFDFFSFAIILVYKCDYVSQDVLAALNATCEQVGLSYCALSRVVIV